MVLSPGGSAWAQPREEPLSRGSGFAGAGGRGELETDGASQSPGSEPAQPRCPPSFDQSKSAAEFTGQESQVCIFVGENAKLLEKETVKRQE